MQQTLLRIVLTDWFGVGMQDGILQLGAGFLLIPWLLLGIVEVVTRVRGGQPISQQGGSLAVWAAVAGAILCVPLVANRLPMESVPVFGWGFMLVLGFVAAALFMARRAEMIGIPKDVIWDLGTQLLAAGIIGSRAWHLIQYRRIVFRDTHNLWDGIKAALNFADGGMVFYGGLLLGATAFLFFCRRRKIPFLLMSDLVMPSLFIGLAFGRLGCFLNGCCFGDVCQLPWGVSFPPGSPPFQHLVNAGYLSDQASGSLPLHPTQIYSAINALLLAVLTAVWFRYRSKDGEVLCLALLTYPITRFIIEFLRSDEVGQFGTTLTISQWTSFGLFAIGLYLAMMLRNASGASKVPLPLTHLRDAAKETAKPTQRKPGKPAAAS